MSHYLNDEISISEEHLVNFLQQISVPEDSDTEELNKMKMRVLGPQTPRR
ncbi:MAG TPA: hypothetical protein VKA95_00080 [Nitrososphaeraceae archaeon]|nr:hypothetical protein [Nitrososphaeraceae archaeon]